MDFRFTPAEQAFRDEVRKFVIEEAPPELKGVREVDRTTGPIEAAFARKMAQKGWFGMAMPTEYGGMGENPAPASELILNAELRRLKAPGTQLLSYFTTIAPVILKHATEEVKKEFLPKMMNCDIRFAICYSEPEAGNDLANLQTRAILDGDDYVINGQKRFITFADVADYMWAAVRTDPDLPKHKGVSIMIVDTKLPGITMSPMKMMGGSHTNEIFFDNVRVPKKYLVGERGRGFYYMMEALDLERMTIIDFHGTSTPFEEFVEWLRTAQLDGEGLKDDPIVRQRVANMRLRMQAGKMLQFIAGARAIGRDYVPNVEAAAIRHWEGLTSWDKADLAVDIMRAYGCLLKDAEDAFLEGNWSRDYPMSGHAWGSGGGVDINRKIIAQRGLGLPPW